jgi:P4 family phage/plasmid primase-like protien
MAPPFNTIEYCLQNTIPCFSAPITWDKTTQKKKLGVPKGWNQISEPTIHKAHNGLFLITGHTFWVLDFDDCFEHIPLETQNLLLESCSTIVKTRRGFHFYFTTCAETAHFDSPVNVSLGGIKYGGIDIRGINGCIIAPPTTYKIGKETIAYTWQKGDLSTITQAPKEVLELLDLPKSKPYVPQKFIENKWKDIEDAVDMLSEHRATSYSDWTAVIWALKNTENTERALDLAHKFSQRSLKMNQYNPREVDMLFKNGRPGYTAASLFYWAMKDNPEAYYARFNLQQLEEFVFRGDIGLAELYTLENKIRVVCTCQNTNNPDFYMFSDEDSLWHEATGNDIKRHFCLTMEHIIKPLHDYYTRRINSCTGQDEIQEKLLVMKRFELGKVMRHVHNNACARNVLPFLCSSLYDPAFFLSLNKTKHLLPVANGVIDLKTGELLKREAHHRFSFALSISYNKQATTENWLAYFKQVFLNDMDVINWLQTYLGYTLTGETNLQRIVVFWGSGSNSKSVLLGFINKLFKDNPSEDSAKSNLFSTLSIEDVRKKDSGNRDGVYDSRFARIAVINENSKTANFDEELLKQMSGQDPVSVSGKYKNQITFIPQFKIYIATNHKPKFDSEDDSKAIWRRVILVPFEAVFKERESEEWDNQLFEDGKMFEKDEAFLQTLVKNMEGLLSWLVMGAVKYYSNPERVPKKLLEATKEYKKSCNTYYTWLQENYRKSDDPGDFILTDDLLLHWKRDNPRSRENDRGLQIKLGNALKEWNIVKEKKTIEGVREYIYVGLRKLEEE